MQALSKLANFGTEVHSIAQKWTGWAMMVSTTPSHSKLFYNSNSAKLCWSWQKSNMLLAAGICNKENFEVFWKSIFFWSVDACTDSKIRVVDASADPKNSWWMQPMTVILELVDVSTDPRRGLIMPTIQWLFTRPIEVPKCQSKCCVYIFWGQVLIQGAPLTPCECIH